MQNSKGKTIKKLDISILRGEVIEKFIYIETTLDIIITQHYFKQSSRKFTLEFLYDEYCSFALKRRVFEKIVPNFSKINELNGINTIRNYFSHCGTQYFEGEEPPKKNEIGKIFDPRNINKEINFSSMHSEFMKLYKEVSPALIKECKKLGVIIRSAKNSA